MVTANIFGPDLGIVVLVIIAVLMFGSQAPKIARNLGAAGKEFRKAQAEADEEHERQQAAKTASAPQAPAPPAVGPAAADDKVTLSRAELDALLAAREQQIRQQQTSQQS